MAEQRPIVYFQRLMGNYDRQVAEIMKAKREYIVFADAEVEEVTPIVDREPVTVEVLTPKPVPTQVKTKQIVELNAPLEEQEVAISEPVSPVQETPVVPEIMTPAAPVVEPIVMMPQEQPVVAETVVEPQQEEKPAEPVQKSVPEKEPEVEEHKPKAKPMTGLGLNLDSIFNEEFSAEQTGYFGK